MRYTTKQLAGAVVDVIEKDKVDIHEATDELVRILAQQNDLRRVNDVIQAIDRIWIERYGSATITIETAHPISATIRKHLEKLSHGVELREIVNEDLIGGARLRIDDRVIDGTVTGTLEQLRRTLYGN